MVQASKQIAQRIAVKRTQYDSLSHHIYCHLHYKSQRTVLYSHFVDTLDKLYRMRYYFYPRGLLPG